MSFLRNTWCTAATELPGQILSEEVAIWIIALDIVSAHLRKVREAPAELIKVAVGSA